MPTPKTETFYTTKAGHDGIRRVYVRECVHTVVSERQGTKKDIKAYAEEVARHQADIINVYEDHYEEKYAETNND